MSIIYDFIFLIFAVFSLPVYFLRGKINRGFLARLGFIRYPSGLSRPVWVHAVSVGEVNAVKGLLEKLRQAYPDRKLVISTVTSTGNKIASRLLKEGDTLTYLPLDFSFIVSRVLKKINPGVFIIAETEIWPNLISCLDKMGIPVISVNGRISDGSFAGYRMARPILRPILNKVAHFCVQTSEDGRRLEIMGVQKSRISVTGNVKFDIPLETPDPQKAAVFRDRLWLTCADKLLVCGSTHPGEEEILLEAYRRLLNDVPGLKILLVPRHPERAGQLGQIINRRGFSPVPVSTIPAQCPACVSKPVFILDTMGELMDYYRAADIVFVGGSLVKKGGHNIIEPASFMKPVVFGPYMHNFRRIAQLFLEKKAALQVKDGLELAAKIKEVLGAQTLAKELGERAVALIAQNQGATSRNIRMIKEIFKTTPGA